MTSYYTPSGDEGQKVVTSAESGALTADSGTPTLGRPWAFVTFDQPTSLTAATGRVYLGDAEAKPELYQEITLPTSQRHDVAIYVGHVERIAVRVTTLTGTSVRRTIKLSNRGPS